MTATMQAVVYHGPRDVRAGREPVPGCGPGEVRVRVDACAVCGTDLKTYLHGNPRIRPPMIIGHEFTGLVGDVGEGADGLAPGDRVVMATSIACGRCRYCAAGWTNLCTDLTPMGFAYPGGMAEFVTIPARAVAGGHVVRVPEGVPAAHAALAEPLSCTVNACENAGIGAGDVVLVVGAGPMGIMNGCMARQFGAGRVLLAEIHPDRLRLAEAFGFDRLINSAEDDLAAVVRDETSGLGADVVIVAAPAAEPQQQAVHLVRKRGTVCLFASLPKDASTLRLDSRAIHYGELRVVGSSDSTPRHVERAVALIAGGALPADRLVTHTLALDGIGEAYQRMQRGETLRVVLKP